MELELVIKNDIGKKKMDKEVEIMRQQMHDRQNFFLFCQKTLTLHRLFLD
jgi:hypothetical protein